MLLHTPEGPTLWRHNVLLFGAAAAGSAGEQAEKRGACWPAGSEGKRSLERSEDKPAVSRTLRGASHLSGAMALAIARTKQRQKLGVLFFSTSALSRRPKS
jgi:hypothetical protein